MTRVIELANSIELDCPTTTPTAPHSPAFASEYATYYMGKSLYDLREFRRAAHTLQNCKSDEAFFLKSYCLYLVCPLSSSLVLIWRDSCRLERRRRRTIW